MGTTEVDSHFTWDFRACLSNKDSYKEEEEEGAAIKTDDEEELCPTD